MSAGGLTSPEWWDSYWSGITLPATVDRGVRWQRSLADALREELPSGAGKRLLEIGCAPGRWLAWFNQELGYDVAGCDNSPQGIALTRENLALLGVHADLYDRDFLREDDLGGPYDVVISLGVIEHFENPADAIRRHVALVRAGGLVVLEVPNLRGTFNAVLLKALGMGELVRHHNLEVMRPSSLAALARAAGLETRRMRFVGGPDVTVALGNVSAVHGPTPLRRRLLLPALWRARGRLDRFHLWNVRESRHWSHLLLAVFERQG